MSNLIEKLGGLDKTNKKGIMRACQEGARLNKFSTEGSQPENAHRLSVGILLVGGYCLRYNHNMAKQNVYIIAGPNGSGKTIFARSFLPNYVNCPNFVNADLIALGLAPFEPRAAAIKAGKLVLQQIYEYAAKGVDFAFETTLSGKSYAVLLGKLKKKGYGLHLFFLC